MWYNNFYCLHFIHIFEQLEENMEKEKQYSSPYEFKGKIPLKQAIPLGLQHVLAMFVGNLTPLLVIMSACSAIGGAADFAAIQVSLQIGRAHV